MPKFKEIFDQPVIKWRKEDIETWPIAGAGADLYILRARRKPLRTIHDDLILKGTEWQTVAQGGFWFCHAMRSAYMCEPGVDAAVIRIEDYGKAVFPIGENWSKFSPPKNPYVLPENVGDLL